MQCTAPSASLWAAAADGAPRWLCGGGVADAVAVVVAEAAVATVVAVGGK